MRRFLALICAGLTLFCVAPVYGSVLHVDGAWPSGQSSGCWTAKSENAKAGDVLHVLRQGFDANLAPTIYTEDLTLTQKVRQPWPASTDVLHQPSGNRWAISDFVHSTDVIPGVKNKCATASPKPVCGWLSLDRRVVGDSLAIEVACFHRNGRSGEEIRGIACSASDGTHTSPVVAVTSSTKAAHAAPSGGGVTIEYLATLDLSTLTNNVLATVNCDAYPWIGGNASILHSADQTARREFSPRYYLHNASLAAAPNLVYVCGTQPVGSCTTNNGNDTNCVVSTTAVTAAATPCLTVAGAIKKLNASGRVDGGEIRLAATFAAGDVVTSGMVDNIACVKLTRDPAVSRATAVFQFNGASSRPRLSGSVNAALVSGCMWFYDMSLLRSTSNQFSPETNGLDIDLEDVNFDAGTINAAFLSGTNGTYIRQIGVTWTNTAVASANIMGPAPSAGEWRLIRDITFDANGRVVADWHTFGSVLKNLGASGDSTQGTRSGSIRAFNLFQCPSAAGTTIFNIADTITASGFATVQNVMEWCTATNGRVFKISSDLGLGNTTHAIVHLNTFAGAGITGGGVQSYYTDGDVTGSGVQTTGIRTHALNSNVGNIYATRNLKTDIYAGVNNTNSERATAFSRTGNWPDANCVGCRGEAMMFLSGTGVGEQAALEYDGVGGIEGSSSTIPLISYATFTTWKATKINDTAAQYCAGAQGTLCSDTGGGTYTVSAGTALANIVTLPPLKWDFTGASRGSTTTCAGANECSP